MLPIRNAQWKSKFMKARNEYFNCIFFGTLRLFNYKWTISVKCGYPM